MALLVKSDIAKLVLDYLQNEGLDHAQNVFAETSPYLAEENEILKNGYAVERPHDVTLFDLIQELVEIRNAVQNYIKTLPADIAENVICEKSISKKIIQILNDNGCKKSTKRRLIDNEQIPHTSGYIPNHKKRKINEQSPNIFTTSKNNVSALSSIKKNYIPFTTESEDDTNDKLNVFSETILENTNFQNVLVDNINNFLDAPSSNNTMAQNIDNGEMMQSKSSHNQIDFAIQNIIYTTEQNPAFEEVLMECIHSSSDLTLGRMSSTPRIDKNMTPRADVEERSLDLPLKQRLRKPMSAKTRPAEQQTQNEVRVLANEPYTGKVSDVISCMSDPTDEASSTAANVPLSQIYFVSPNTGTLSSANDTILINVPPVMMSSDRVQIPIYYDNDQKTISFQPGMILPNQYISTVTIEPPEGQTEECIDGVSNFEIVATVSDAQPPSEVPFECTAVVENKEETPKASSRMNQIKAKSLSTPRRKMSHVRALNFNTLNENDHNQIPIITPKSNAANISIPGSVPARFDLSAARTSKLADVEVEKNAATSNKNESHSDHSGGGDEAVNQSEDTTSTLSETPKIRKSERRSVCRVLSAQKPEPSEAKEPHSDNTSPLTEWKNFRSINRGDWDKHLRIVNKDENKSSIPVPKRKRRRPSKNSSSNSNEGVKMATQPEIKKENGENQEVNVDIKVPPSAIKRKTLRGKHLAKKLSPIKIRKTPRRKPRVYRNTKKTEKKPPNSSTDSIKQEPADEIPIPKDSGFISSAENSIKCITNIATLLDTPYKLNTEEYPATPRFAMPALQATPMVKLPRLPESMLKCSEFPTPNMAITPGVSLTPMCNNLHSPKSGTYPNRPTDYSSGSSYYKPDESDDIDDAALKTPAVPGRDQTDNEYPIKYCPEPEENVKYSINTSKESESDSNTVVTVIQAKIDLPEKKPCQPQLMIAKPIISKPKSKKKIEMGEKLSKSDILEKLETARNRTIEKFKNGPEIITARPKIMSFADRRAKVAKKQELTKEKPTTNLTITKRSKRKMASPIKKINTNKSHTTNVKPTKEMGINAASKSDGTEKTEQLLSDSNDNAMLDTFDAKLKNENKNTGPAAGTPPQMKNPTKLNESTESTVSPISPTATEDELANRSLRSIEKYKSQKERETLLFGSLDTDLDTPAKKPSSKKCKDNEKPTSSTSFSITKTSTPQSSKEPPQSKNTTVEESKNPCITIEDDETDSSLYDPYDCCSLSFKDINTSNQYFESCCNTNNQKIDTPARRIEKFKSLAIIRDDRKIVLSVSNEIELWPQGDTTSTHCADDVQNGDRKPHAKFNIKHKEDGTSTAVKVSTEKRKNMQPDTKEFDINLVLRKVHPLA